MAPLPLFFRGLTPELVRKAEIELNETPHVKEKAVVEFRRLIKEQNDIHCRPDELFLLRFLRVKKYDVHKALKVLRNYYNYQRKQAGVITYLKPSNVKNAIEMNISFFSPYRLHNGSHIAIFRIGRINLDHVTVEQALAVMFICGELVLESEATQICGGHMIVDFSNISFQLYRKFICLSFAKFSFDALQDSWPGRTNGIHFLHEPFAVHALMSVAKHFATKKVMERIHCHGDDLSSLHKHIPKEFLPEDFGGRLGSKDYEQFASYVLSQESVIEEMNKYGIVKIS